MRNLLGRLAVSAAAVVAFASFASPAYADDFMSFDFQLLDNTGVYASGALQSTLPQNPDGSYTITAIIGTTTHHPGDPGVWNIVGLDPTYNGPDQNLKYFPGFDVYPDHGRLTLAGLSFFATAPDDPFPYLNALEYNIFGTYTDRPIFYEMNSFTSPFFGKVFGQQVGFTISPSAVAGVPEPATWALLLGGFGLAGAALRRRQSAGITPSLA